MEDTGIRFSSLTVDEDEISYSMEEEEDIYSSSEESEWEWESEEEEEDEDEVEDEDEDEDGVVWSPDHPYDLEPLPKSVLLEVRAYFDDRTNATTALAPLLRKHRIQVTLWMAHPPRASRLTVHSSGVDAKEFANMPMVVAAQDDLVLLRVTIGLGPRRYVNNYYVYKAGVEPSLTLLPDTSSCVFDDCSAGILRLGNDGFVIAAIQWALTHGQYHLHQFDSRTWSWSTRLMHTDKPERFTRILTSKVLVIGGEHGLVAWVDLWNGILFCEVLTGGTVLRYCPLPPALSKNEACEGPPEYVRDIAVVQGRVKFFEMRLKVKQRQVAYNPTYTSRVLAATTWKMMDPWQEWHKDCAALNIFKIPEDESNSAMLPDILELALPALSLHEDDVVYIMAKTKEMKRRAVVLAVNLRRKVLQGVAKFDAKRKHGFSYTYLQSGVSNYLTDESSVSVYKELYQSEFLRGCKYVSTVADPSRLPVTQADDMKKGNDVDSSRRPIAQAGDMNKANAAAGCGRYSAAHKKRVNFYRRNVVDSSRRPITQAGGMYEANGANSGRVQISGARTQRLYKQCFQAENAIETGFDLPAKVVGEHEIIGAHRQDHRLLVL